MPSNKTDSKLQIESFEVKHLKKSLLKLNIYLESAQAHKNRNEYYKETVFKKTSLWDKVLSFIGVEKR